MKKIGIVCDLWKTAKFKERLEKENFKISKQQSSNVATTFAIEVEEKDFVKEKDRLSKVLRQLEIELKQSN